MNGTKNIVEESVIVVYLFFISIFIQILKSIFIQILKSGNITRLIAIDDRVEIGNVIWNTK